MSLGTALDVMIAVLVLGAAGWMLAARDSAAAVIGFVVYGLLLALIWVRLEAVDVALTEAAIGSGVTGVFLFRAAAQLRVPGGTATAERTGPAVQLLALALCLCVVAGLGIIVLSLPEPAPSLAPEAVANLGATQLGNPVTAVLLGYRAFDTLLEKIVLLLAVIGVWSLAPDRAWGRAPPPLGPAQAEGPLVFLARVLPPVGVIVGIYLFWAGADRPGGAFPGASVLASMWLLVMLAGLRTPPRTDSAWLLGMVLAGPLVFLAAGLAGFVWPGVFLGFPPSIAKPLIVAIEVPLTLSIAAMLAMMVAGPPQAPPRQ